MMDYTKAADDARRLLRGFKAFAEVADALDAAGTAVQAKADAEKALAKLQVQLAEAQGEVSKALAAAADTVAKAKARATDIESKAQAKADALVADAAKQVAEAQAKADAELEETRELTEALVHGKLQAEQARDALVKECAALEQRLADAKASIAKLLG